MPTYRIVISETADKSFRKAQAYDESGMESGGYEYGAPGGELFDVFDESVTAVTPYQACIDGLNKYRGAK